MRYEYDVKDHRRREKLQDEAQKTKKLNDFLSDDNKKKS